MQSFKTDPLAQSSSCAIRCGFLTIEAAFSLLKLIKMFRYFLMSNKVFETTAECRVVLAANLLQPWMDVRAIPHGVCRQGVC